MTVHDPLMIGPWRVPAWVPLAARRAFWRWVGRRFIDPVALADINAARAARALAPVKTLMDWIAAVPDLSLTLFPDWFAPTQPDWPRPLVRGDFPLFDPNGDAQPAPGLIAFLQAGTPPLVFTHGTGNTQAAAYFRHAYAAATRLGRRAIFLTPHRDQVPAILPPTMLWQAYVPLRALLPHAAALIHHGGIGTTAEALRAGTPQLVVPLAHDQFDNGARVAALGAGASLPAARLNERRLVRTLGALLAAPRTRIDIPAGDGIDRMCAALEDLANARQRRDALS
jgi:rhamnosyltransferase subunit B